MLFYICIFVFLPGKLLLVDHMNQHDHYIDMVHKFLNMALTLSYKIQLHNSKIKSISFIY
jgi:hypothetical protein